MPTGYTASVQDGKIDFKQFALQCARAFGATIMQRDEPMNELPKIQEPSDYHSKRLTQLSEQIEVINKMSLEEAAQASIKKHNDDIAYYDKSDKEMLEVKSNYTTMLEKSKAWVTPSDEFIELKDFMIKQLTESIDFDCSPFTRKISPITDGETYKAEQLAKIHKDIFYHTAENKKEIERTNARNKWIETLYNSL